MEELSKKKLSMTGSLVRAVVAMPMPIAMAMLRGMFHAILPF